MGKPLGGINVSRVSSYRARSHLLFSGSVPLLCPVVDCRPTPSPFSDISELWELRILFMLPDASGLILSDAPLRLVLTFWMSESARFLAHPFGDLGTWSPQRGAHLLPHCPQICRSRVSTGCFCC